MIAVVGRRDAGDKTAPPGGWTLAYTPALVVLV